MDEQPNDPGPRRGDEDWENRFRAAWTRLNDASTMVALDRRVATARPERPPKADVYAGEQRLRESRRVGVLAGSFNPLTHAHLAVADAAARALELDTVLWTIAAITVDKERTLRASVPDRIAQLVAFAAWEQGAAVALINRGLYVDQAQAVRALLPADAELMLLVGYDKLVQIFDPHYYADRDAALEELFALARLAVVPRAGAGKREVDELVSAPQTTRFAPYVRYVDLPSAYATDSSTQVRELAAQLSDADERISALVPPEGAALLGTSAFDVTPPEADRYLWRQRWLERLAEEPDAVVARVPGLDALVGQTIEQTQSGRRLRSWLAGERTPERGGLLDELERLLRPERPGAR